MLNLVPKLLPFLTSVIIYFVLFIPQNTPSLWSMFIKCLPIFGLMIFVLLCDIKKSRYSTNILYGLMFSVVGDAFLIWQHFFTQGMLSFAVAHVMYIRAFGFRPLKLHIGVILFSVVSAVLYFILPSINDPVLSYGVPVYSLLLGTTTWRATARVHCTKGGCSWPRLLACLGAWTFVVSDFILSLGKFHGPVPYQQVLVMGTYYAAQFAIAVSVVEFTDHVGNNDRYRD